MAIKASSEDRKVPPSSNLQLSSSGLGTASSTSDYFSMNSKENNEDAAAAAAANVPNNGYTTKGIIKDSNRRRSSDRWRSSLDLGTDTLVKNI